MNIIKSTIIIALLSLTACKQSDEKATTLTTSPSTSSTQKTTEKNDKTVIETLVKNMYLWNDKRSYDNEFQPVVKRNNVIGYNAESHKLFLKELRDSGYFADEFIKNIDKIWQDQNKLITDGKVKWSKGDMGPFAGDVNIWCGCQDEPAEYTKIAVHFDELNNTNAKLYWNWEGFGAEWEAIHYNMRCVKENGKWKIAYMQGWDYAASLGIE
jgi:hypothetical protein